MTTGSPRFGLTGLSRCRLPRRVRRGPALPHRRVPDERPGDQRPVQREGAYRRIEQVVQEAAEAERAAYLRWQEAYGAYELTRDKASAAWTAWVEAIAP
jgi:hypothetical protein